MQSALERRILAYINTLLTYNPFLQSSKSTDAFISYFLEKCKKKRNRLRLDYSEDKFSDMDKIFIREMKNVIAKRTYPEPIWNAITWNYPGYMIQIKHSEEVNRQIREAIENTHFLSEGYLVYFRSDKLEDIHLIKLMGFNDKKDCKDQRIYDLEKLQAEINSKIKEYFLEK